MTPPYSLALVALLPFHMVRWSTSRRRPRYGCCSSWHPRLRSLPGPAPPLVPPAPYPADVPRSYGYDTTVWDDNPTGLASRPAALLPFRMVRPFEATRRTMSPVLGDPLAGILCSIHLTMLLGGREEAGPSHIHYDPRGRIRYPPCVAT